MACELVTEQSLSDAFAKKGLGYLQRSVTDLLNGYNLANRKNRRLYTALTGDAVQDTPFWTSFKESSCRRNDIVHGGGAKIVPKSDAENSYKAANELWDLAKPPLPESPSAAKIEIVIEGKTTQNGFNPPGANFA
jgi:hypothetical protein